MSQGQDVCVKCIICNLGAMAPLQEMAGILPHVALKGKARLEVIEHIEKAEAAASAARACLLNHLGLGGATEA